MSGSYFWWDSILANVEICGKCGHFWKVWSFLEKQPFFQVNMAGLGKYHMGGCGRIGVHRDNP